MKYSRAVLEFSRPPYEKSRPGERRDAPSWRGSPVSPAMGRRLPVQLVRRHSDIAPRKAPRAGPDERLHRPCLEPISKLRVRRLLTDVANELRDRGALDEEECFIDATFVMAKGGGAEIGATKRGKGMKIMAIVDRHGLPSVT